MVFGLGYIIGVKYSAIIAAGSFLSWLVMVPLVHEMGSASYRSAWRNGNKIDRQYEHGRNLPNICPTNWHRRHRDGGNHRHHPFIKK